MAIALVETKPSRTNFREEFPEFEFDHYYLCSDASLKKVLKRDCDIQIDLEKYHKVILVGSDALKYFTKYTAISDYTGTLLEDKFLPIINPGMMAFKPEMKKVWQSSKESIVDYILYGKETSVVSEDNVEGIQDEKRALEVLQYILDHPRETFGLDSETSSLYPRTGHIIGISLSIGESKGYYIDTSCIYDEAEELLQELLDKKTPVMHNAKFDIGFFEYHLGVKVGKFHDTMMMHYILDENPGTHGLKQLAVKHTKWGNYEKGLEDFVADYCRKNKVLKSQFTYDLIPFDVMYPYASLDALVTLELFDLFSVLFKNPKFTKLYYDILIPATRLAVTMQDNGVPFDRGRLASSQVFMQAQIDQATTELYKFPQIKAFEEAQGKPFNPNSVMQLRSLLFDYLGLNPTGKKTATGAASTDAEVLQQLAEEHEVPNHILKIRKMSKIKNTYLDKIMPALDSDSRLRTNFNIHGTTSGRLSSSGTLNMQQLPRDEPAVKGSIRAREGYMIVAMDLTTAEMYIAAVLSGDKSLQEVFKSGGDFHGAIAKKVFRLPCEVDQVKTLYPLQRQMAKAISFGILYGASANKISQQITKDSGKFFSVEEAQEVIDEYFAEFKQLDKWIKDTQMFIKKNGFLYSHFGRKRRLPDVMSSDRGISGHALRSGLNFAVQSPASDINLIGAIELDAEIKAEKLDAKIFALVHDSILAEVHINHIDKYKELIAKCIQRDRGLSIPGCPVGIDIDVHEDYSLGKFEEQYGDNLEAAA